MVDVVASFGYNGQDLQFVDQERFAHVHGKGLYLYDTIKGPREIIWRSEKDLRAVASHVDLSLLFLSFATPAQGLEVVRLGETTNPMSFANPFSSALTQLEVSRSGERLYALSDVSDHRLAVWTLNGAALGEGSSNEPPVLVASKPLDAIFHKMAIDPCDEHYVALWGPDGLYLAFLHEVFDAYTLKVEKLFPSQPQPQSLPGAPELILFCTWLPFHRLLVGLENGDVFEVHATSREEFYLGKFCDPQNKSHGNSAGVIYASCVTLTSQNVLVGAHDGGVYWFSAGSLFNETHNHALAAPHTQPAPAQAIQSHTLNARTTTAQPAAAPAETALHQQQQQLFAQPLRVLRLSHQPISSLAIDPTFSVLIAGTFTGALYRAQIESDAAMGVGGTTGPGAMLEEEAEKSRKTNRAEAVDADLLGNDALSGVVVVAKFLSLGVRKISSRAKATLSLLLLGTHDGALSLWRYSSSGPETIPSSQGFRRSAPRAMKQLVSLTPHTKHAAIVAIESVFYGPHTAILALGLDNGMLEFWVFNCIEQDEDETRESSSNVPFNFTKLTEDDEGSIIVKFEVTFLMKTQCFHSAFSSLSALVESSSDVKIIAAAADEKMLYVFSLLKNAHLDLGKVIASYEVSCGNVVSTVYMDEFLFAVTDGLSIMRYFPSSAGRHNSDNQGTTHTVGDHEISVEPERLKFAMFGAIARLIPSPVHNAGVVITAQGVAYYYSHSDDINFRVGWEKVKHRKLIEHKDLISCAAFSPNGNLLGIGSIDGSLTLWKVEGDSCNDIILINSLELHKAAIVSLVFSSDSSTILTAAVDATCHLLFVGGKSASKARQVSLFSQNRGTHTMTLAVEDDINFATDFKFENNLLLLEDKLRLEEEKELRANYKFKCMGVSGAVQEIVSRLKTLIAQNDARSPLEQLPREEFVIDLRRKEEIEMENLHQAQALRESYDRRGKFLELLAARLRKKTWDTLSTVSLALRPLLNPPDIDVAPTAIDGVTSFSIPKPTAKDAKYLEKIKRLRRLELRSMRAACERGEKDNEAASIRRIPGTNFYRCSWSSSVRGCPVDCTYIVNDGVLWPLNERSEDSPQSSTAAPDNKEGNNKDGNANKEKDKATNAAANKDKEQDRDMAALAAAASEDDMSVGSVDDDNDVDETEFLNLLYAPQTTRSLVQKKNQLLFLREIVRRIKEKFNTSFTALRHEKDDLIQFVNARSDRIAEILGELKQEERVWRPQWLNDETPKNQITVSPEELLTQPYESEAVKQQRQREAEEKERRARGDENELVKQRALEDMMHGTLEVKRDVLADALSTMKPAWMDELSPAEMNEQQLKEFEAYKEKLRVLQEEQAHYRKTLEQEMKKLKQEVIDQCKAFNDKLDVLAKQKILVQKQVLSQEMYMTSIANSVVKAESLRNGAKKSEDRLSKISRDRADLKSKIDKFAKKFDEMKSKLLAIQEEEKNMEKSFKRDLQNLCNNTFDQDSLKIFTQLYRLRTYPRNALGPSATHANEHDSSEADASASATSNRNKRSKNVSGSGVNKHGRSQNKGNTATGAGAKKNAANASKLKASRNVSAGGGGASGQGGLGLGPMQQAAALLRSHDAEAPSYKEKDPFYTPILLVNRQKKAHEIPLPLQNTLSMELDCPEGFTVDQFSWSKLQELRNARIEKEIENRNLTNQLQDIKTKLQVLDDDDVSYARKINEIGQQRDQALQKLKLAEQNLNVLVYLLQGQDEVDRDSAITDYSSGLLLPVEVVNKFNARIKELGNDKIGVLSKIKLFRRKINLIAWEALHQGLHARHFENYYTDLQLFRVTRDLQKVILEGENAFNQKERVEKINSRKEYLTKEYHQRHSSIHEKLQSLEKAVRDKEAESQSLREKIQELEGQVQMSMSIKKSKESAMGPDNTMEKLYIDRMKKVVNRRKLVDLARAQAEEIDFLRQELDRMRQRTFPSFVKATKTRIGPT